MPNSNNLTAEGLFTFQNYLSKIPQGALVKAENVVIDRDGIIEPSRGFTQYGSFGSASSRAKQLVDYKTKLLVHYDSKIAHDNGSGTFTDLSDSYAETSTGLRIKSIELNGSLYLTTSLGIKKIATTADSPYTTIEEDLAGGIKASDLTAVPDYSAVGFFTEYSKVSYRVVWLKRDINGNLIIGYPSARYEITNAANQTCQATVNITIPADIPSPAVDDSYFFQIYRSSIAQINTPFTGDLLAQLGEISSDDEMRLVYEAYPTQAEWTAGELNVTDIVPADYRDGGANLYTNENSGSGIAQANYRPPFAYDIALYKNTAFFANTKTYHSMNLTLTGMGNMTEIGVSSITYSAGTTTITTTSAHGLVVGDYFVLRGVKASTPTHYLNDTWQTITGTTGSTIKITTTDWTGVAVDSPLNAAIYTSYIAIAKSPTTERYFFTGRRAQIRADFSAHSVAAGDYFEMPSMNGAQLYYIWYYNSSTLTGTDPALTGYIGIKVSLTTAEFGVTDTIIEKTLDAVIANTYDFEMSLDLANDYLYFNTPTSGTLDVADAINGASSPGLTFTLTQEGYGEKVTENWVRLSTYASPATALDDTARSLVSIINKSSTIIDASYTSSINDVPGKMFLEALAFDNTPFSLVANSDTFGDSFSPDLSDPVDSTNEESPNRMYYSKTNEPEHVPRLNYIDIGPKDKAIIRIVGLQDSLFIFKEEGIYRLTGETASNFNVRLHDSSGILIAPDSATVLNNQIYCYTTQGIVSVSEAGMSIISRPIENVILKAAEHTNFATSTFGLSSETDRALYMFTTQSNTDDTASIVYRYNVFTRAWTTPVRYATCGVLNHEDNKFYLGAEDSNILEKERKDYSRKDFANRQYTKSFQKGSKIGNSITLSSSSNIKQGDIIVQTQYLTISHFNMILRRLDIDPLVKHPSISDYFAQEAAVAGDDINDNIEALVIKLNLRDLSHTYTYTPNSNFATIQTNFNTIITDLNASTGVFFTDYDISSGTVDYEMRIDTLNRNNSVITSASFQPVLSGTCIVYNYIPIDVVWAPNFFGEPNVLKHVREATLMFEDNAFTGASFGFNSDLSGNFESIGFNMSGDGLWGGDEYDSTPWGGTGTAVPFRTYIPRQKQRCRFIRARFQSSTAFTKFSILGLSFTFEGTSERAYK